MVCGLSFWFLCLCGDRHSACHRLVLSLVLLNVLLEHRRVDLARHGLGRFGLCRLDFLLFFLVLLRLERRGWQLAGDRLGSLSSGSLDVLLEDIRVQLSWSSCCGHWLGLSGRGRWCWGRLWRSTGCRLLCLLLECARVDLSWSGLGRLGSGSTSTGSRRASRLQRSKRIGFW